MQRFELEYDDIGALRAAYERELRHGRVFVPGAIDGLAERAPCTVVLVHPDTGEQLELAGTVARLQAEPPGAGVELTATGSIPAFLSPAHERRLNPYDRLRALSLPDQLKLARGGELQERVALERLFGKHVWEALLQNPRLTIPEVARIARKGTVPRPLLDVIVDNPTWVKAGPVRRALLTNPRIGSDAHVKILRLAPKNELKLIEKQALYPSAVREAARRMLRG